MKRLAFILITALILCSGKLAGQCSVSIAASANPVCAGTLVTFTPTTVNGGTAPSYQWFNGANLIGTSPTLTYAPGNNDLITCILTSDACPGNPVTSNPITMIVTAILPVSVSIAPSANNVCEGISVTLTAAPVQGGTASYQWYKNSIAVGSNSADYIFTPVNGDQVYVVMTSSLTCTTGSPATSNTVVMIVNPVLPISVSVAVPLTTVCEGTPVTFTATPVNEGTPSYQWYKNSLAVGSDSPNYTFTPVNNDQVKVVMTSSLTCKSGSPATSNTVTMAVTPNLPVSVTVAVSANPVCEGTSVTFTATPANGGSSASYQWYKNSAIVGSNSANYTYTPVNGDQVHVVMTSSLTCTTGSPTTSNIVTMIVNPILPVSVTAAASLNPVCAGTPVTFTATPVNEGTPAYQWFVNNIPAGPNNANYTFTPGNGDQVHVVMTSSLACKSGSPATSNSITMIVSPNLPVSVTIAAAANPVCDGTSVAFTATPVNGGTPVYQWYKNTLPVGTNDPVYTYVPVTGDKIYVAMTSSLTCTTGNPDNSNTVTMNVNPILPVSISIAASANPVCVNSQVTFTATSANGGTTPVYQWKVNGLNRGTNNHILTYIPAAGDIVTCVLTSNAICATPNPATSNALNMTVIPTVGTPAAPVTPATTICQGSGSTAFTTLASDATSYNWNVSGTGNTISGTGTTGTVLWSPGFSGTATISVTADGCNGPSASGSAIVTVRPAPTATISGSISVCLNAASPNVTFTNPQNLAVTVTYNINGSNPATILVGANASATLAAPTSTSGTFAYNLVRVEYVTGPACPNNLTGTATIIINPLPLATLTRTDPDNFICSGTSETFTAGGGTNYNFRIGGISVQNGSSATYTTSTLANGQVVSVIVTNANGCVAAPISITNFVNPLPFIFISSPAACSSDLTTYSLTVQVNTGVVSSTAGTVTSMGGNVWVINGVSALTNITIKVTDGNGCVNTIAVTSPNCACPVVNAPVSGGNKSYCENGIIPAINATVSAGLTVDWYSSETGGVLLRSGSLSYSPTAPGTYYAIARNVLTNCLSSTRTAVVVTMNPLPIPALTSSDADNSFCVGTSVTFTAAGGTNFEFLVQGSSVQNSAVPTYSSSTLTNGQVVSVIVTNANGCKATSAGIVNTINQIPVANAGSGGNECDLTFIFKAVATVGTGTWAKTTGPGTVSFAPNANAPTATVTVSEYGTYTFTWTVVSAGCSASSAVTVNFYRQPVSNPGSGGNNCGLESSLKAIPSIGTGTWTKTSGPGTATFTPNANAPGATVNVSLFGQYTFTWTEVNGPCSNSASANINFLQVPAANAGNGGSECDLDFILNAVLGSGSGTWSKFSGPGTAIFSPDAHLPGAKVTVSQFGTYDFTWTEVSSTCQSSDVVRVIFRSLPTVYAGRDTVICKGDSVQLNAQGTGTFLWQPDTLARNPKIRNPFVTPLETTSFSVTLSDQFGCKKTDTLIVNVRSVPIADAGPDQNLEYLLMATMNAKLANIYETGKWSLISGTGVISDLTNKNATVTGLSLNKNKFLWTVSNDVCPSSSDTVTLKVNEFKIPTLITPNHDGKNDYFVLNSLSTLGKTELVIFDRRGVKVFESLNYDNKWDGVDYNNNPLPDDTYFYVLKTQNGKSLSGYIVIRR